MSAGTPAPEGRCRSCAAAPLRVFLSLGDLPLSDGFLAVDQLAAAEPRYPLDVAFCAACGLVQILKTLPPEELFGDAYPYFSSFADTVVANARANVAARLAERQLGPGSLVVELASNDGYLLQHYRDAGVPVLGIDPAAGVVEAARTRGIDTLHAFFGRDLGRRLAGEGRRADVVHANNVLAHVADTNGFVAGIAALLTPEGVAVIEVPYVRNLIAEGQFDTIYHEHLCYFSATALVPLFRRHGLDLARVEQIPIHGGSLRLFVSADGPRDGSVERLLAEERAIGMDRFDHYARFGDRVARIRGQLAVMLRALKAGGARLAGYGAAAKGTIMLNCAGIGADLLDYVVDRNTHKQGRWIPGVRIPIADPARLLETQPDYVLILPWNFKDEIMAQQAEYQRRGGRFIVPIPDPAIVRP
jgi:SAM-dependent methyltransferase